MYSDMFVMQEVVSARPGEESQDGWVSEDLPPDYDVALHMKKPDYSRIVNVPPLTPMHSNIHMQQSENCDIDQKCPGSGEQQYSLKTLSDTESDAPLNVEESSVCVDMTYHVCDALPSYTEAVVKLGKSDSFVETVSEDLVERSRVLYQCGSDMI